jgi:hypothetical protein
MSITISILVVPLTLVTLSHQGYTEIIMEWLTDRWPLVVLVVPGIMALFIVLGHNEDD